MALITDTVIPSVNSFYSRDLLQAAKPHLIYHLFAQNINIPQHNSKTITFRRYNPMAPALVPLIEGQNPAGSNVSTTDIQATVQTYGDFLTISEEFSLTTADPYIVQLNEVLGQQAGLTFDTLVRDAVTSGTTVQWASTSTSRATVTSAMLVSATEVNQVVRTLRNNNASVITKMITPSSAVNTQGVLPSYFAICHTNTVYDLNSISTFLPVNKYPSTRTVYPQEVGALGGARFLATTNAKIFAGAGASGIDVYGTMFFGMNAYGQIAIEGKSLETKTVAITTPSKSDPLGRYGTHGWVGHFTTKILNDSFMARLEHAVST